MGSCTSKPVHQDPCRSGVSVGWGDSTPASSPTPDGDESEPIGLMGGSMNLVVNDVESVENGDTTAVITSSDCGKILKARRCISTSTSYFQNGELELSTPVFG